MEVDVPTNAETLKDMVDLARAGDRDAFDRIIMRFETMILKTALCLLRNQDDARDVAQDVYIKIFAISTPAVILIGWSIGFIELRSMRRGIFSEAGNSFSLWPRSSWV